MNTFAVLVIVMLAVVPPIQSTRNDSDDDFLVKNDFSNNGEESHPETTHRSQDEDLASKNNSHFNSGKVLTELPAVEQTTICPNIRGKSKPRTVVKCHCQGMEVYEDGKCQPYEGVVIPVKHHRYYSKLESIIKFNVTIQDVNCDPDNYLAMNFTKNRFQLRDRGDIVLLKDAGKLEEQRINKYCLIHQLDSQGYLTWKVKTCVPKPYVPRCCPNGNVMKDGECQSAKTPSILEPPIMVKPHSEKAVEGLINISTYTNNLICRSEPMRTIPLGNNGSHLLLLADGLTLMWKPNELRVPEKVHFCPEYCIDGVYDNDGRVEYFASFCYMTRKEAHEKACEEIPCIRKCCKPKHSYDTETKKCVPDSNSSFSPTDITNSSSYTILFGYPLCEFFREVENEIKINSNGQLILNERHYPSTDYCVDIIFNKSNQASSAFVCGNRPVTWKTTRIIIIPIAKLISLVFLSLSIVCHLIVPKLLARGGVHQLCHILSLTIAYSTAFTLNFFHADIINNYNPCFGLAIGIQYGFLATFFWLNVMCFEVWRKIRKLTKYQHSKTYPEIFFMLYAWGIPLCICSVTVMMQFVKPHEVRGEIRPYIAITKCWFEEDAGVLLYFYGPIAILAFCNMVLLILTLKNTKIIVRNSEEASKELKTIGRSTRDVADHVQDFYQKFKLFALSVVCWSTEILSWKIPPEELWAPTDVLNALQGLFVFIILLTSPSKRGLIEEKFPMPFRLARRCIGTIRKATREPAVQDQQATPSAAEYSTSDSASNMTASSVLELSSISP